MYNEVPNPLTLLRHSHTAFISVNITLILASPLDLCFSSAWNLTLSVKSIDCYYDYLGILQGSMFNNITNQTCSNEMFVKCSSKHTHTLIKCIFHSDLTVWFSCRYFLLCVFYYEKFHYWFINYMIYIEKPLQNWYLSLFLFLKTETDDCFRNIRPYILRIL